MLTMNMQIQSLINMSNLKLGLTENCRERVATFFYCELTLNNCKKRLVATSNAYITSSVQPTRRASTEA